MVLSMMQPASAENTTTEPSRDIKLIIPKGHLSRFASMFAQLHVRNKKALTDGEFILSHEITRQIQDLLFDFNNEAADAERPRCPLGQFCVPRVHYESAAPSVVSDRYDLDQNSHNLAKYC